MNASDSEVMPLTSIDRGIGLAVTTALLKEFNACVLAMARTSNDALIALAAEHQETLLVVLGDIVDPKTSQEAVTAALEQFGHLDGIVLNAGVLEPTGRIEEIPVDGWKSVFDVNFFSLIPTIQSALPALRKAESHRGEGKGKVIMISSGAAVKGNANWGPYSASKAAMNSLARTLATEEKDVTTIALRPGMVDTDMQAVLRASDTIQPADLQLFKDAHSNGKLVKPEDVGYTIASLALRATTNLSGEFVSWDSESCAPYRRK
ncbi:hypothetical protein M408DRAFT_222294 [Serendipita vermifera MAFF 305830]|uniref:Short-chain dehydrogenase n=1 Tax=Serendipita vermifera MAFF 305830 TaxID=933852 RepID=A0A0C3B133_SERVB|nr:hypothetical protein M408DRAFT_222294 [Serendipita vermifera MAFF 305830]